jgi:hypothetical protein
VARAAEEMTVGPRVGVVFQEVVHLV